MSLLALRSCRVRVGDADVSLPDLVVGPGARIAVIGPNGSGKTTLLRALASLAATEGERSFAVAVDEVVLLAQRPYFLRGTLLWNVALPLRLRGVRSSEADVRARDALARFGVAHLADRGRTKTSGGEAQRAALARAFVTQPRVLLLDEPLAALDDAGAEVLARELAAARDTAVVVAAPSASGVPPGFAGATVTLPVAGGPR